MDAWFILWPGSAWPLSNFEPLIVGISFPMSRERPWLVRQRKEEMVEAGRALCKLSRTCHVLVGNYLRKLWLRPRDCKYMQGGLVRGVLHPT